MRVRFGDFTLDEGRRVLSRGDVAVHLTPKAFDLLVLLAGQAPRVLPKAEIHARLWPGTFVSDATLVGVVKEIRRALGEGGHASIVRTVHRVGYAMDAAIERVGSVPEADAWHWLLLAGRRYPLRRGENVVGRDPDSQVWLDGPGISRRHASIAVEEGHVRIADLGSKNGTTVSGQTLASPVSLRDGDRITFGPVVAIYRGSTVGLPTETVSRLDRSTSVPRQSTPKW